MGHYIIRRALMLVPVLFGVSLVIFTLIRVMPGDIAALMAGDPQAGVTDVERIREELGLTRPLHEQYLSWVWGMLQGDFGRSLWTKEPVLLALLDRLPVTVELALLAILMSLSFGIPVGILMAIRQDTWLDYVLRVVSILGLAMPGFWMAILILTFSSIWFHWVPPLRYRPFLEDPWVNIQQFLLPAFVLASHLWAIVTRMTRSTLLEVLRQDYVRTAWAKGLQERAVVMRHALKNALIPVVTIVGNQMGYLLGGTVIVESIFSLPGIGRLTLDSIFQRDYPQIQGNYNVPRKLDRGIS